MWGKSKDNVVHIDTDTHRGILHSSKNGWDDAIWDNIDGPRGYYAKWNKSYWQRQMPYDFAHKWNLNNDNNNKWINKKQNHTYKYRE